jgi:uncharacterized OB-fold protein
MAADVLEHGRLVGSRCPACEEVRFPRQRWCACGGVPERLLLDGRGHVLVTSTVRKGSRIFPTPYQVAQVALVEGPVLYGRSLDELDVDDEVVLVGAGDDGRTVAFRRQT